MKKSLEDQYAHYLEWYATPENTMTFEEFARSRKELEEKQRQLAEESGKISIYQPFVSRVENGEDWYAVQRELKEFHDKNVKDLHEKGENEMAVIHGFAFKSALHKIRAHDPLYEPDRPKGPRTRPIIAENVYDDEDKPTTHYL